MDVFSNFDLMFRNFDFLNKYLVCLKDEKLLSCLESFIFLVLPT